MLIALAIIRIVVAITIPSLTYNSRKQEWVSALAKSYKGISDAFALSQMQNGVLTNWEWEKGTVYITENYIVPYLRVSKDCKTEGECFAKGTYKGLNDANWGNHNTNNKLYKVQLVDGSSWAFGVMNEQCIEQ